MPPHEHISVLALIRRRLASGASSSEAWLTYWSTESMGMMVALPALWGAEVSVVTTPLPIMVVTPSSVLTAG